ncbi:DUF4832 domain-containing protein [Paenibacillus silvisoli]|uniref:DUF4832 domain-containing protein n=1 Tax=Paenibacillus silvisoli TaxID=3110539 RepID=UPI0028045AF2|nr:DUF4832 domain-containing protein [Paenibacillus silvisoli]
MGRQAKTIVVRPKLIDDLLLNPGIGFTTFQRFNGDKLNEGKGWTEGFPIEYQDFSGSLHNADHPDTSIAYFRVYWRYLEPEEGRYRWDIIDKALATARERQQTLMFRAAPYGRVEGSDVPDWYRNKAGEMTPELKKHDWWRADPENPLYVRHFGGLIRAFGERYDGHPDLDSVDISIVGPWGEGAGSSLLTGPTREALVDCYIDTIKKTPLMMLLTDEQTNKYGLSKADVGFRVDCLGDMGGCWENQGDWSHMNDYYPQQIIVSGMQEAWKKAPISFEVCWVVQHWKDKGWDIDYIIDQSLKWHISTFNAKSNPIPKEWQPQVKRWLNKMGYRFALRKFTYPSAVQQGGEMEIASWWENLGVAPCYKAFPLALRLRNDTYSAAIVTGADIRQWLPGDSLFDATIAIPADIAPGHYRLELGLLDRHSGRPAVRLAIEGRQPDGWYALGDIEVSGEPAT